jgi:hypothetical protein
MFVSKAKARHYGKWLGPGVFPEVRQKSSLLSADHRLVIALCSPDGVGETGLLVCLQRKRRESLGQD